MTWELAVGIIGLLISHIGVEVYRHWKERGKTPREHKILESTSQLTVAQANLAAEDVETKKLDRTERLYRMVDDLRERMQVQDDRIELLSDELDAEREARQASEVKLRKKVKMSVTFAEHLLSLVPPPPPELPPGWEELHDFE